MSTLDTTPRRWKAADRPAIFPPTPHGNPNVAHWELVAINSRTATVRNHYITGEMAFDAQDVRVLDPLPWLITEGDRAGHRLSERPAVTPVTWEPRTLASLRAAGVVLGIDARSPLDTGERAEPRVWSHVRTHELHHLTGAQLTEELDRFGRVDFDDDEGSTVVTVHTDRQPNGAYAVYVYAHGSEGVTVHETAEDANPDMREALATFRARAERAADTAADAIDADDMLRSEYEHEQACRDFAPLAAAWIAERLGETR